MSRTMANAPSCPPDFTPSETSSQTGALLTRQAPALSDPLAALRIVRNLAPSRFFAGAGDIAVRALLTVRLPDHVREVTGDAVVASRIDDGHGERHQRLVRLAQAYVLTGDEGYAESCVEAIDRWLDANPEGAGAPWASALDVSFRLMSWCWTLLLLRESKAITPEWLTKLLAAIWQHANHVWRHRSYSGSSNTSLTGEALGLFYAGTLFPEFADAPRWRDVAVGILVAESQSQIHPDGVHVEQSTCYHCYTLDAYLHFLLLAARNDVDVPPQVAERVQDMVEFLLAVRQPDQSIPEIGDSDGGVLLPLSPRRPGDHQGVFAVAAAMFRRPDFVWAADGLAPELAWLTGSDGVQVFDDLPPALPPSARSRVFPSGGYAVMRTGWEREAHQMIVDIGPLGCSVDSGHGHADLLSIQCSVFGEPCMVDAGTVTDPADSRWRDLSRSTAVHSTIGIDGLGQAEPAGPYGWLRHPRAHLREWHSTLEFDFLDAEHDAYLRLPDPVLHRRRVIFVKKPGYWILIDDLSGAARHQVDLQFQFGPIHVTLEPHPWARAATEGGRVLWVAPFPPAAVQPSLRCGNPMPTSGWISAEYGQRRPAPMLIYSSAVALPWRIVTLLLPDRLGLTAPPAVRAIYDDGGLPTGFAFERPRRVVRFDDRAVLVERG